MLRGVLVVLLVLAGVWACGCRQEEMIRDAERQSFYQAPPNLSSDLFR
jgi:hypothetical protein